jgi:hypothetical protein
MNDPHYLMIFRGDAAALGDTIRQARRTIAAAIKVLQTSPPPDTFLGRKHRELIPLPDQDVVQ